jgi:hypothetical protein
MKRFSAMVVGESKSDFGGPMKLVRSLLFTASVLSGTAAQALPASVGIYSNDERVDLINEQIVLRRGATEHEFKFDEAAQAPSMTVWYERSPICQGFGLQKVEVMSGEEWVEVAGMKYGENQFYRTENINISGVRFTAVQNHRLRMRCQIHVVAEETSLPQLITMLARVNFVSCSGEEESISECKVQLQRIDEETAAPMVAEQASAVGAKLENNKIYRLEGYVEANRETGAEEFHINSSELVLP